MARAGEVIEVPGFERLTVRRPSADTGGELLELEAVYRPHGKPPPLHYHPRQEERFEALEGTVQVRLGGERRELAAGQSLVVPARVGHSFWNAGDEPARLRWQIRPALRTEEMFEALAALGREGRTRPDGTPKPLPGLLLVREFRDEFRLERPPKATQDVLFALLTPVAALAGRPRE